MPYSHLPRLHDDIASIISIVVINTAALPLVIVYYQGLLHGPATHCNLCLLHSAR